MTSDSTVISSQMPAAGIASVRTVTKEISQ